MKSLLPPLTKHVVHEGALRAEGFSFAVRGGREVVLNVSARGRYLGTVRCVLPRDKRRA